MEIEKKEYGTYVKEITPVHSTAKNMLRAFLAGGVVCTIGQACLGLYAPWAWRRRRPRPGPP